MQFPNQVTQLTEAKVSTILNLHDVEPDHVHRWAADVSQPVPAMFFVAVDRKAWLYPNVPRYRMLRHLNDHLIVDTYMCRVVRNFTSSTQAENYLSQAHQPTHPTGDWLKQDFFKWYEPEEWSYGWVIDSAVSDLQLVACEFEVAYLPVGDRVCRVCGTADPAESIFLNWSRLYIMMLHSNGLSYTRVGGMPYRFYLPTSLPGARNL